MQQEEPQDKKPLESATDLIRDIALARLKQYFAARREDRAVAVNFCDLGK
jgi:hypothetical protein